jgi:hypothetical protein
MKPRCKHCGRAFLDLDARGVPAPGKIKCELDGVVRDASISCERFLSQSETERGSSLK